MPGIVFAVIVVAPSSSWAWSSCAGRSAERSSRGCRSTKTSSVLLEEEGLKLAHRFRRIVGSRRLDGHAPRALGPDRPPSPARHRRPGRQAQVRDPDDPRLHDARTAGARDRVRRVPPEVRARERLPDVLLLGGDVPVEARRRRRVSTSSSRSPRPASAGAIRPRCGSRPRTLRATSKRSSTPGERLPHRREVGEMRLVPAESCSSGGRLRAQSLRRSATPRPSRTDGGSAASSARSRRTTSAEHRSAACGRSPPPGRRSRDPSSAPGVPGSPPRRSSCLGGAGTEGR